MDREDFLKQHDPTPDQATQAEYQRKLEDEIDRLKKRVGTDERVFRYIKNSIEAFPAPKSVNYEKPKLKHDALHAVLNLTDAHAEETVLAEEMEGLSEYNWDIFLKRMDRTASKTLELVNIMRQASNVRLLDINALGDWFTGKIQPQEEGYGQSFTMPVAVPKVGRAFGLFLTGLSAHFEKIRVNCVCGNHGRDTLKPVYKMTADRNWDMSVYLIAQGYTENCPNIEWHIPKSIMYVSDVVGWKCLLSHSMEVKMTHRTPYYPIETTIDMEHRARAGTAMDFHYAFMGHWHHYAILDNTTILCPSMIGANQYSRFRIHKHTVPAQLLCFFTRKHGLVTQWPIRL